MAIFVGETGIKRLWTKITEKFVQKETGKVLSDNNFSASYKTEVDKLITQNTNENKLYTSISSLPATTGLYRVQTSEISGSSATYAVTKNYYSSSNYTLQASNFSNGNMFYASRSGSTITWKKVGSGIEVVTSNPTNAVTGDIWIRSDLS